MKLILLKVKSCTTYFEGWKKEVKRINFIEQDEQIMKWTFNEEEEKVKEVQTIFNNLAL